MRWTNRFALEYFRPSLRVTIAAPTIGSNLCAWRFMHFGNGPTFQSNGRNGRKGKEGDDEEGKKSRRKKAK